jgi:hypothetical protein
MGIEHLNGKRTGRRPGTKSRPSWEREIHWAYKNLDREDAKPPSALAGRLLTLGREHPDRFAALLLRLGELGRPENGAPRAAPGGRPAGKLQAVFVPEKSLLPFVKGHRGLLPEDFRVVQGVASPSRRGFYFLVTSASFALLAEGEPIPEVPSKF